MVTFNENSGILTTDLSADGGKKLSKGINLRAFYIGLHNLLVDEGFKDMLGTKKDLKTGNFIGGWTKAGEFNNAKTNRAPDMFEKKFILIQKDGFKDFEIIWKAFRKLPYSGYGWMEYEINLACRVMKDIEILDGNNKKTLQSGTWEIKQKFIYKNNIILKYLEKVPFVKNSPKLKEIFWKQIHFKQLEEDVKLAESKYYFKINKFILNTFT